MAMQSQGTALYFVSGTKLLKVKCPTGFDGVNGGEANDVDVTCLDAKEYTSKMAGLKEAPALTSTVLLDSGDESHKALVELGKNGKTITWCLCLSDGTTEPTLTGEDITPPTGRSSIKFNGYVKSFPWAFATNDAVKGTLTIQTSGTQTVTWKGAE